MSAPIDTLLRLMIQAQNGEKLDISDVHVDPKMMDYSLEAFKNYVDSENFESHERYYDRLWPHMDGETCEAPAGANTLTEAQKKETALHFCKFFFRAYPAIDEALMEKMYSHASKPVSLNKKIEREIEKKVPFEHLSDVIHGFFEDWATAENAPSRALILSDSTGSLAITAQMIHEETDVKNHFGRYFLFSSKPPIPSLDHGPFIRSFGTRNDAIIFAIEKLASNEEIEIVTIEGVNDALLAYKEYLEQMFPPLLGDSVLIRELQCVLDKIKRYFRNHQTELSMKYRKEMGKVETKRLKKKQFRSLESPRRLYLNRSINLHRSLNSEVSEWSLKKNTPIREEISVTLTHSLFEELSKEISLDFREKLIEVLHDHKAYDRFIGLAVLGNFPKVCPAEVLKEQALGDLRKLVLLLQKTVMLTDNQVLEQVKEMYQLDNDSPLTSLEQVVEGLDAYEKPNIPSLIPTPQSSPIPSSSWPSDSFEYPSPTPLYAEQSVDSFNYGDIIEIPELDFEDLSKIQSPEISQLQEAAEGTPHANRIEALVQNALFDGEEFINGVKELFDESLWDGALYLQTNAFDPTLEEACLAAIFLMKTDKESLLLELQKKIQPTLDQNGRGGAFYLQIYLAEKKIKGDHWETSDPNFGKNEAFTSLPRLTLALKNLENSATQ